MLAALIARLDQAATALQRTTRRAEDTVPETAEEQSLAEGQEVLIKAGGTEVQKEAATDDVSSEPEPAPEERIRREAALVLEQCAARLAEAGPADDDGALQRALGAAEARWQAAVEAEWAALARRATGDE